MPDTTRPDSYLKIQSRFDHAKVASKYVVRKNTLNNSKNIREMACIESALTGLPANSRVLDLPCGSGRLEVMLLERGYTVVAADYAHAMIEAAQAYHANLLESDPEKSARLAFQREDILNTTFEDNSFDAIICNRLLHHYPEAALRQQVLTELKRISKDRIIVSFFSNFALSALKFHASNTLSGTTPDDRIPIWYKTFEQDIQRAGLRISGVYPVRRGISPQTYLKLTSA
jgi:SAM-dependent methyltransferase